MHTVQAQLYVPKASMVSLCLFFVKVDMHPLQEVWDDAEKRLLIMNSINSMSDSVLIYKNLEHIKTIINK
jgi:hypothetical protein